jgi:hypothetical protein
VTKAAAKSDRHCRAAALARLVGRVRDRTHAGRGTRDLRRARRRHPAARRTTRRGDAWRRRRPRGGRGRPGRRRTACRVISRGGASGRREARRTAFRDVGEHGPPTSSWLFSAPTCTRPWRWDAAGHTDVVRPSSARFWRRSSSVAPRRPDPTQAGAGTFGGRDATASALTLGCYPDAAVVDHVKCMPNSCPILTSFRLQERAVRFGARGCRRI